MAGPDTMVVELECGGLSNEKVVTETAYTEKRLELDISSLTNELQEAVISLKYLNPTVRTAAKLKNPVLEVKTS